MSQFILKKEGCIPFILTEAEYNECKHFITTLKYNNMEKAIHEAVSAIGFNETVNMTKTIFQEVEKDIKKSLDKKLDSF